MSLHDSAGQFPHDPAAIKDPTYRTLGYFVAMTLANTTAAGVAAATLDSSALLLLAWGGVLGGLEVITGIFAYLRLRSILKNRIELAELMYKNMELDRLHGTLRSSWQTGHTADETDHKGMSL